MFFIEVFFKSNRFFVTLITTGAGESAVTAMAKDPIAAFVFDVKGLMADISLKGAKFNKLDLSK